MSLPTIDLHKYLEALDYLNPYLRQGHVQEVVGLTVACSGIQARLGELCFIHPRRGEPPIIAEVVGFRAEQLLLMPLGEINHVGQGSLVTATGKPFSVQVGMELLGRVLDGLGQPMDGRPLPPSLIPFSTVQEAQNPLFRKRIEQPLGTGIRALDTLLTVGRGQRLGIFAGSGVGKSTLMGMVARQTDADVIVIGLIGERGREVREFLERDLGEEGLRRSVVVVATSDQPALVRMKGAVVATTIAEYFRSLGLDVLLLMDSITRYAMAAREVGLATGEPPATRGYPPSVFSHLPKLLERAGTSDKGSITAFYTVLVDGDDMNEPVADAVRGILDGHIVLDRRLANKGHFPAIDVLQSVSRLMNDLVTPEHLRLARALKEMLAIYRENEDLITIGAYQPGNQPLLDKAVKHYDKIEAFLRQDTVEPSDYAGNVQKLEQLIGEIGV